MADPIDTATLGPIKIDTSAESDRLNAQIVRDALMALHADQNVGPRARSAAGFLATVAGDSALARLRRMLK